MARARTDSSGESGREVRQQRLPLSWREESRESPAGTASAAASAVGTAPTPADAVAPAAAPPPAPDVPAPGDAVAPVSKGPDASSDAAVPAEAASAAEPEVEESAPADARAPKSAETRAATAGPSVAEPVVAAEPEAAGVLSAPVGGGVGDLLLGARADSGFSVEEASARTRIPRDVIEHLECSAYHALPSEYYCRAHIERLCALYNVEASPILERFHDDMVAQRGEAEGLGHFRAVTTDSESGAKISYVLPGPGATGRKPRSLSLTGAVVSGVIGLFLLVALVALAALHFRNRQGKAPPAGVPAAAVVGHKPPVPLQEFMIPKQLNAYELPIPDK